MGSQRVFIVDDEAVIASTLAAILRKYGYDATPFTSAEEAMTSAINSPPDLLLSDVVMPRIDGVALAQHFRHTYPECRILLFSGQAATLDLLAEARSSGDDFELLEKPIHPADLLMKIHG